MSHTICLNPHCTTPYCQGCEDDRAPCPVCGTSWGMHSPSELDQCRAAATAAPELLATVKELLWLAEDHEWEDMDDPALVRARELIRRVEGVLCSSCHDPNTVGCVGTDGVCDYCKDNRPAR